MFRNKIILIGTSPRSIINFRGELLKKLISLGYSVTALACRATDEEVKEIQSMGVEYIDAPFERASMNPYTNLKIILFYKSIFKKEKPFLVLCYTIKPIIWGGLASRLTNIRFYALVTGIGFTFQGKTLRRKLLTKLVTFLYKISMSKARKVIFQNKDNRKVFVENNIVSFGNTEVINGSGVNISHFSYQQPIPIKNKDLVFLCMARLLNEKGLREFEQASAIIRQIFPNTICQIAGFSDESPDSIPIEEILTWHERGSINYLGAFNEVRPLISACHVFVLPSYHEGLPRSTIEAMAMGKPVITTSAVGCRETVKDGKNGFKIPVADVKSLVEKMIWFIENPDKLEAMGLQSRNMVEEKFDVHKINNKLLKIMEI